MLDLNKLIKEKRELWYQAQDLRKQVETENRLLTKDEINLYDTYVDKMKSIQDNIDALRSMNETAASLKENVYDSKGTVVGSKEEEAFKYNRAVNNWIRKGSQGLTPEERKMVNPGVDTNYNAPAIELRTIGAVAGTSNTVATDVMAAVAQAKRFYGNFLSSFYEFTTAKGNPLMWPKIDDSSATGGLEAAAGDAFDTSTAVTFTSSTLNGWIYSSQGVGIANDALEDGDFDIASVLGDVLGTRLWRKIATDATTGTGTTMITGIAAPKAVGGAPLGVRAGACVLTRARILQLMGRVDYANHLMPGCGFMMSSSVMYEIAGLASSTTDNRPLWQPSMVVGVPDKLEGFPYWVNNSLSTATYVGTKALADRTLLFGDFKAYKMRYVGSPQLIRLTERYADLLQTGFIVLQRCDGKLLMPNATTYAPVKYLAKAWT